MQVHLLDNIMYECPNLEITATHHAYATWPQLMIVACDLTRIFEWADSSAPKESAFTTVGMHVATVSDDIDVFRHPTLLCC